MQAVRVRIPPPPPLPGPMLKGQNRGSETQSDMLLILSTQIDSGESR